MEIIEERVSEIEDRPLEVIKSEELKGRLGGSEKNWIAWICGTIIKGLKFVSLGSQKERKNTAVRQNVKK